MLWSAHRPIDPTRHRFISDPNPGYTASLFEHRLRIGTAPQEVAVHRGVRYVPPSLASPDIWASGGLMSADGDLIPLVRGWTSGSETLLGLREPANCEPGPTIDGDVLYLGWLFDDFGHLLLESLARIWALDFVPATTRVLFHYWPGVEPPASHLAVFAAFGVGRERIIIPEAPATFSSLLIPDPAFLLHSMAHERAATPFRALADRLAGDAPPSDQPVYLSRSLLPSRQRAIVGEDALEALLRDNGFLIVHPETMPFSEQVRFVASHRVFVAPEGGSRFLTMFAPPGSHCHVLMPEMFRESNILVSEIGQQQATYHHVTRSRHTPFAAMALDVRAAAAALADDGLLPNLARVPDLPGDVFASPEFDEAWLFASLTTAPPVSPKHREDMNAAIDRLRPGAWPVFAALVAAASPEQMTGDQADALMLAFVDALAAEEDSRRRFRHAVQVRSLALHALARCQPDVQRAVRAILDDRMPATA